ncbi:DNA competence protein [Nitrincola tapanii]|uniref:DNA competence protein n=2 Tax=Nitrincola tapanii TaxID=1708751 RepID=A0A5A9W5B9_9GAMM|nr:DNA competence protein [Nitrincola tapanii]
MENLLAECETRLSQAEARWQTSSSLSNERNRVNASAPVESNAQNTPKARSKNRAANLAALQLLQDAYPQVFAAQPVRALKIGIQEDLIADAKVAKNKIKRALASFVRSPNYLRSLQAGAARVDLQGQEVGEVTAEEAEHARQQLREMHKLRKQRQKEQEQEALRREKEERMNAKLDQLLTLNRR